MDKFQSSSDSSDSDSSCTCGSNCSCSSSSSTSSSSSSDSDSDSSSSMAKQKRLLSKTRKTPERKTQEQIEHESAERKSPEPKLQSPKHEIPEQMTLHSPKQENTTIKNEKDESEHVDVDSEIKLDTEMVDVVTTDKKIAVKPDLDAIIVESGKIS